MKKYNADPTAYKRRIEREKTNPAFKNRIKEWEKNIEDQPTFDTENEAVKFALEKTKKGEEWTVFVAPKELGGKWKAISWNDHQGMGPESANMLGWSMIYDTQLLKDKVSEKVDIIEEV